MNRWTAVALTGALTLAACSTPDADLVERYAEDQAGLGRCSVEHTPAPAQFGNAIYDVTRALPAHEGQTHGLYAIQMICRVPGPAGPRVAIMLPTLTDSIPSTGEYVVWAPGHIGPSEEHAEVTDRVAWAYALLAPNTNDEYHGVAGTVHVDEAENGRLIATYQIAFNRSPDADPTAPERLVLGGTYAAARNLIDGSEAQ
jgi:hypothetical protein